MRHLFLKINDLFPGLQRRPGCRPPPGGRGFLSTSNQLSVGWSHEEDAHSYAKARVYPTCDGTQGPYLSKWRECRAIGAGSWAGGGLGECGEKFDREPSGPQNSSEVHMFSRRTPFQ